MAGHSKWANIQHRKGRQDAKKAKFFTKAAKDIIIAAKAGGGNPEDNSALRLAIQKAKAVNMPNDKITTAIKKGTGELAGGDITETIYEGYGPGGVAIIIEVATDNKNRTVADIRHLLNKSGGNMGESGSVAWMFDKKGVLTFSKDSADEEQLFEIGLEAGVEDVVDEEENLVVYTEPTDFTTAQKAYEDAGLTFEAELSMIAKNEMDVDVAGAKKILNLMEALEDHDDVQKIHVNADFSDEVMAQLSE
ncbi:MAG: YebC/PmpR family DNA-binding transcriptional regulator [Desulfovibrio sp.]